jgi:hypothetical protein
MPNNTILNPGTGGDTILTVDLAAFSSYPTAGGKMPTSVLYVSQAPGSAPLPLSAANALPVNDAGGSLTVDGTVAVSAVGGTVAVSGPLTDSQLRASPVSATANLAVGGSAVTAGNPVPVSQATSLPAGTNTIGGTIAQIATGVVYSGATALTPKFAPVAAAASGDNTLVVAVPGKRLRVLKYTVVAGGAVSVKFRSASATDLTGAMALAANSGVGGAFCPVGLFETAVGESIVLNLSATASVAGHLTYIEV